MSLRLHEVHPSIAHFPLVLLPASLMLDTLGRASGNKALMRTAGLLMPAAVVSGVITGLAGLIAQQSVNAEERAHDVLVTHRNLNMALVGLTGALAAMRMRRETPGIGYLLAGFASVAAMNYSAYLGGKMVYAHGVGVESAKGVRYAESPEITRDTFAESARLAVRHIASGVARFFRELLGGEVLPLASARRLDSAESMETFDDIRTIQREEETRFGVTGHGGAQGGYGSSFYGREKPPLHR